MAATCSFRAIGTTATLVTAQEHALAPARALLERELAALDLACSRFRSDSELAEANVHPGQTRAISPLLCEAIQVALEAAESSGGLVDPALGTHMRAAGYDRTYAFVRARGEWTALPVERPGEHWRSVALNVERSELRLPRGVELDLGATAKAWAADRAANLIAAATGVGVLVSLGGDLAVAGSPPAGGWPVFVTDDHAAGPGAMGQVVAIAAGGLATSSTAVRRWRTDSGEAHHILDPRTGRPAETCWRTASVAAATCVDANVAATAAIVLGAEAPDWLEERGLPARLVANDGAVSLVRAWPSEAQAA